MQFHSYRRTPHTFTDPITSNLIKTQFSWKYLCGLEEQSENWEQKRWCKAFDLVVDVYRDLVALPADAPAGVLVARIGKTIEETDAPRGTKARLIKDYIKKARGKIQTQEDRETRLAMLTEQARKLKEDENGD